MASGTNDSLNSCWKQAGGGVGSRFSVLDILGEKKHGGSTKRLRHSTGGASIDIDISPQQSESMRLSLEKFKEMDTDCKLESIFEMLQSIKLNSDNRLENVELSVRTLSEQANDTHDQVKLLRYKSIDAEARSRRSNLIFRNIPEQLNEDPIAVIKNFLGDKLELDPDEIYIHRAHRLGRYFQRRKFGPIRHRPIIVAFRDFQDVEMIISSAHKLKGSSFGINRDIPSELLEARKPLWTRMKTEKSRDPTAKLTIVYPAKLLLNGKIIDDTLPDWQKIMKQRRIQFSWQESTTETEPKSISSMDPPRGVSLPAFASEVPDGTTSDPDMEVWNESDQPVPQNSQQETSLLHVSSQATTISSGQSSVPLNITTSSHVTPQRVSSSESERGNLNTSDPT